MEANMRLPITDNRRIHARDVKLQYRENVLCDTWHAEDRRHGRRLRSVKCKCCICMGSSWSKRSRAMAAKHLQNVGRHPFCRGRTENWDMDSSDEEWEHSIRLDYGARGTGMLRDAVVQLDVGLDVRGICEHTLHHADALSNMAAEAHDLLPVSPRSDQAPADFQSFQPDTVSEGEPSMCGVGASPDRREGMARPDEDQAAEHWHENINEEFEAMAVEDPDLEQATPIFTEQELLEDEASTLLFCGASLSSLGATLLLLNLCRTHGTSNLFISELFTILSRSILPTVNTLPQTEYMASKKLKSLRLKYDAIHVCPNNCMLFHGEANKDLTACRTCSAPRFRQQGGSRVPIKVLRYFPLIPRLKRMFSLPLLASFMTWYVGNRSEDGYVRHAADSRQWEEIDKIDPSFTLEHRNLRLGLATDGVNPFSIKRSTWSTWPILLFNYNIPPWMTTKQHFIMLSMIIPGPKSVTSTHFDVFLEPLIEELLQLWNTGVPTIDASVYMGISSFTLRAILIWTMHDFPAYGIVSGLVTKGYLGCPICGPGTKSRYSRALGKNIWDCMHRKYLSTEHRWRREEYAHLFNGMPEHGTPPIRLSPHQHRRYGSLRQTFEYNGSAPKDSDPARRYGVKRIASLWRLLYWKDLPIRHTLDPMHIERNFSANILKHLFGEADSTAVRKDMKDVGRMENLWLQQQPNSEVYTQPPAPYVLTDSERREFLELIGSTQVPTGYSATLRNHVRKGKLVGLKSHDHHVLIQQIMPAAIRHMLKPGPRDAIIKIGNFFHRLGSKVIHLDDIPRLLECAAEALCLFEMWFPPSFFDIMTHLPIHLVEELYWCGPISARWCYPVERYLGTLTKYVRDRSSPEASMAAGYNVDEALGYCTEFFQLYPHVQRRIWDHEEELHVSGEQLKGAVTRHILTATEMTQIHHYVITHSVFTAELYSEYQVICQERETARSEFRASWRRERNGDSHYRYPGVLCNLPPFADWLYRHVRELRSQNFPICRDLVRLSSPPSNIAASWKYMFAYGAVYRCLESDRNVPDYITYHCGVARMASGTNDGIDVGILKQIIMVDYGVLKPVLMKVSWVKHTVEGRSTIKKDRHGFWTCKLNEKEDSSLHNPYVYPSLVSQVFFMTEKLNRDWRVILSHEPRSKRIIGEKEQHIFEATGAPIYADGMVPGSGVRTGYGRREPDVTDLEAPLGHVVTIDVGLPSEPDEDAIYDDDQYEDEFYNMNEGI